MCWCIFTSTRKAETHIMARKQTRHPENTNASLQQPGERLQKALASAGVASRRDCEQLITSGRVTVNGKLVQELGTRVDMEHDTVYVDGEPVRLPVVRTYIMLHKPVGIVSTVDDPQGRQTVCDLVNIYERVFPVGRLDADSEGLILLTNDGELTHHMTHPRFEVEKEYHALVIPAPDKQALHNWRTGVMLEGKKTAPARVETIRKTEMGAWIRIVMREGRKRQIREIARILGYKTKRLIRVREGNLKLGDLPAGNWRKLRKEEVEELRRHIKLGKR